MFLNLLFWYVWMNFTIFKGIDEYNIYIQFVFDLWDPYSLKIIDIKSHKKEWDLKNAFNFFVTKSKRDFTLEEHKGV